MLFKNKHLSNPDSSKQHAFKRATEGSAGWDLFPLIDEPVTIEPGQTQLISSGISLDNTDKNMAFIVLPRSGLGAKHGVVLGNLVGLIDSDYQGEIFVSVWNRGTQPVTIEPDKAFAQGVFIPVVIPEMTVVDDFPVATTRGSGGFGHTDKTNGYIPSK